MNILYVKGKFKKKYLYNITALHGKELSAILECQYEFSCDII